FWITFNQSVRRDWLRTRITLVGIQADRNVHLGLGARHDLIWDANALVVESPRAEVRMQRNRAANEIDNVGGVRVHRSCGDVRVPQAGTGEWNKSVQTGSLPQVHAAAGAALGPSNLLEQHKYTTKQERFEDDLHISILCFRL